MSYVIDKQTKVNKSSVVVNIIFFVFLCQRLNPDFQFITWIYSMTPIILSMVMFFYVIFVDKTTLMDIFKNRYVRWILIFTVLCFLSFTWSLTKALSNVNFFIINLITMIPMSLYLNDENRINDFLKIVVFASTFTCIYILLFADLNIAQIEGASRLAGDSETWNSNNIGLMCSFSVIISLYLKKTFKKNIYVLNLIICTLVAVMTGSRKTIIVLVLGIALFYVSSAKRGKFLYIMCAIIGVILSYYIVMSVPILYYFVGIRLQSTLELFNDNRIVDSSTMIRLNLIKNGWIWFKEKPILGVGIDNYRYLWENLTGFELYAHNNYIEILVDLGIMGGIVYYSMYLSSIIRLIKSQKYNRYLFATALSILLTILCIEMLLVSYNSRFLQIILCLVFSITQITLKTNKR